MKFERFTFVFFLLGIFLVGSVLAENVNGTEWRVLNISEGGNVTDYTENPMINNSPQLNVSATMDATNWWAEVQLNESSINFGHVEKGNRYNLSYQIWARGTLDINVIPRLKTEDSIFSNIYFSRIPSEKPKEKSRIGNHLLRFNLTSNKSEWLGIGSNKMEVKSNTNGKQIIWLDLTNFEGIVPFEMPMENTIIFQINPIWSSVEPIPPEKVYEEFIDED